MNEPDGKPDDGAGTLLGEISRLRKAGYTLDFYATAEGRLACRACEMDEDPATMKVDFTARFEGQSNPDDESILLALTCECGSKGLYTAAYGPSSSPEDTAVLNRLT